MQINTVSIAKIANIRRINVNVDLKVSIKEMMDAIEMIKLKLRKLRNDTVRHKRNLNEATTINVKKLNIPKQLFESKFRFV